LIWVALNVSANLDHINTGHELNSCRLANTSPTEKQNQLVNFLEVRNLSLGSIQKEEELLKVERYDFVEDTVQKLEG
jgi:hypothetical protein